MAQSESWKPDSLFGKRGQKYLIILKMSTRQLVLRNSHCSSCLYHPKFFVKKVQILYDILNPKDDPFRLVYISKKTVQNFTKSRTAFCVSNFTT